MREVSTHPCVVVVQPELGECVEVSHFIVLL
jgi:hypothetical protein